MLSQPLNKIIEGAWKCESCRHINFVEGARKHKYCEGCGKKNTKFTFLENESTMETYRETVIQECSDEPKSQYDSILINIPEEFTSSYFLRDKIAAVGFLRIIQKNKKDVREFYIGVKNIHRFEDNKIELSSDNIKNIEEFSKKNDHLDALAKMYVPSIIGMKG